MKKLIIAAAIAVYFLGISAMAQVKSAQSANNHTNTSRPVAPAETEITRSRVTRNNAGSRQPELKQTLLATATAGSNGAPVTTVERPRIAVASVAKPSVASNSNSAAPTQVYRVGVGDILDIRIPDSLSNKSTLYTVLEGGLLDYPLAGAPLPVSGMTTDAIAQRLSSSVKVLDHPQINVKVRDYSSHTVNVIGFVSMPGSRILRREAVPLYVVLSEAMPLPEAASVTIVRNGSELISIDMHDSQATSQLVVANDILKVSGAIVASPQFFFAGGEVNAPGQKVFHEGLTLTQAILASGGASLNAGPIVRISRQTSDGRLMNIEYNLKNIQSGKTPDPIVQKGDRIEVNRAG